MASKFFNAAINNSFPNWELVTSDVPQGSVLGPLLFAIYVNDMPSIVSSSLFKFADDTKLYRAISNSSDRIAILSLQNDLDLLYQ